ncbi:MAG: glycoside hydrolase family 32 protein, partial [Acidobacteriaceae bacterium]|nr:glycoside hydrolase family 32 protein [Acidobacteriaceae bacterium]
FGDQWGHMSWGHAVSKDMLHWTELPVALKEENGIMIFTGSAVVDWHNSSGFCANEKPCLVAVYTGHTPPSGAKPALQTQNIAYSNDRGRTWTKYKNNPVLDLHMADFRDPKVFWFGPTKHWIMAVSLPNDHKVRFYESPDLKKWAQLSDFGPAGATGGQWECPELFQLPVEGEGARPRWVLKVGLNPGGQAGGSGEQYFVGDFDGKQFKNDNPSSTTRWTDYGKDCYCALTFNDLPRGQQAVMIGWMDNWQYAAKLPTSPWRGQMTIPRTIWLVGERESARLYQRPIAGLAKLVANTLQISGASAEQVNAKLRQADIPKSHTFEFDSTIGLGTAQEVGWRILHQNGPATVIGLNPKSGKLFIDRTHSGTVSFSPDFPARMEAPLQAHATVQLQILVDRSSIEVFAEGGQLTMTSLVFPSGGANGIEAYATPGGSATFGGVLRPFKSTY